jgi:hypothetical protein
MRQEEAGPGGQLVEEEQVLCKGWVGVVGEEGGAARKGQILRSWYVCMGLSIHQATCFSHAHNPHLLGAQVAVVTLLGLQVGSSRPCVHVGLTAPIHTGSTLA